MDCLTGMLRKNRPLIYLWVGFGSTEGTVITIFYILYIFNKRRRGRESNNILYNMWEKLVPSLRTFFSLIIKRLRKRRTFGRRKHPSFSSEPTPHMARSLRLSRFFFVSLSQYLTKTKTKNELWEEKVNPTEYLSPRSRAHFGRI